MRDQCACARIQTMSFAFEATDTAITEKVSASSDLSAFPGENPSEMELEEWVLKVMPKLKRNYGAILRLSLIHI